MVATTQPITPTATLLQSYQDIFGITGFLNRLNVERREEIELLGLSTIAGIDTLFLGEPGVGKTWAIELLVNHCLVDMTLFSILMSKDMSPDEVLGPRDVMAMKQGRIARLTDGFLPRANYVYLDEIFKSSPPLVNPLLDVLANRVLKVGGTVLTLAQLLAIFMSSNELPDREDLQAFRDRIGITKKVEAVQTPDGRRAVTDIQLAYQGAAEKVDTTGLTPLTLDDIMTIRAELRQIEVPDALRDMMTELEQAWFEAGHAPSQRRKGQMWKIIKANAWAHGRSAVIPADFVPVQHMAWNHPDHADSARNITLDKASQSKRRADELRTAFEPIMRSMQELRQTIEGTDTSNRQKRRELYDKGFDLLSDVRELMDRAEDQIADGNAQGADVTETESVLAELQQARDWGKRKLIGEEDE